MGNVRSVTCARILKARGYNALACSLTRNGPKTIKMLAGWASKVLWLADPIPSDNLKSHLTDSQNEKIIELEIGPDIWEEAMHPELVKILKAKLDSLDLS